MDMAQVIHLMKYAEKDEIYQEMLSLRSIYECDLLVAPLEPLSLVTFLCGHKKVTRL